MRVQPLLAAQRLQRLQHRHGAVFQRDAGVLGLRAFVVGGVEHHAGEEGRGRRAVVDRGDRRAAAAAHQALARGHAAASSRPA
jgi:hypothetical protein